MDLCAQVVSFRVVVREQFDVPVHVGEGTLPIRCRQLRKGYSTVAVAHRVVRV